MKSVVQASHWLHYFIHQPRRVFFACLFFVGVSLILNGSLLRIYGLHRDYDRIGGQILQIRGQIVDLNRQLAQAQDPQYIERQAMDRYDLADENDLIFVFADE